MSALTFTLKATTLESNALNNHAIDCRQLTPNTLVGLSNKEIGSLVLPSNAFETVTVDDVFDLSGGDANNILFKNTTIKTSPQLDYLGYGMKEGQIIIKGNAGDYLGANMQGGKLICQGNAQERIADRMRRGILLIDGDVGAYCCSRMIAGTVGIHGSVGPYLGYGLRRGTILLTKSSNLKPSNLGPSNLLVTWLDGGTQSLPFLSLLSRAFKSLPSKFSKLNSTRVQRFMGDASNSGKGEILIIQD